MEEKITITRSQLAAALAQWEKLDRSGGCEPSDNPERHNWTADYLIELMKSD